LSSGSALAAGLRIRPMRVEHRCADVVDAG
jgi:hypothetical protein